LDAHIAHSPVSRAVIQVVKMAESSLDRRRLRGLVTLVRRHLAHAAWMIETGRVDKARELLVSFDAKLSALEHYEREARAAAGDETTTPSGIAG
jgi:hypothetical protein